MYIRQSLFWVFSQIIKNSLLVEQNWKKCNNNMFLFDKIGVKFMCFFFMSCNYINKLNLLKKYTNYYYCILGKILGKKAKINLV